MTTRHFSAWLAGAAGAALVALAAWLGVDNHDSAAEPPEPNSATSQEHGDGLPSCPMDTLPAEANQVAQQIVAGGPFAYPANDGTRFGNYEGILPERASDYYREYTVDTPGVDHRGARRIITGGPEADDPEVWYYTSDHYESFCEIPDNESR